MKDNDTKNKFVELRARGYSYDRISKELKVSKKTLIEWARKFEIEINNLKQLELEALKEKYFLLKRQRIERVGKLLNKIEEHWEEKLDWMYPEKSIPLYLKLMESIETGDRIQFKKHEGEKPITEICSFNETVPDISTWEG